MTRRPATAAYRNVDNRVVEDDVYVPYEGLFDDPEQDVQEDPEAAVGRVRRKRGPIYVADMTADEFWRWHTDNKRRRDEEKVKERRKAREKVYTARKTARRRAEKREKEKQDACVDAGGDANNGGHGS